MDKNLKIADLDKKLRDLIDGTYAILEETDNTEIKQKLDAELKLLKNRTDLKIAFVGQYSSGKSTIISAITGNKNIKIDANVATDTVSEYRWKNIVLMDTPGILAGRFERHDESTRDALRDSDLVVYVITSQLFDDIIFENFIDLAYNQQLKDKMLIAVNKMGMEAGEFEELEKVYLQSIKAIFADRCYSFEFETVFIDAADYIEGVEDEDDEFIELSNFSQFISALNGFVEKKGIIKKQFDSPVRLLRDSVAGIALEQVNPDLGKLIKQGEDKIRASRRRLSTDLDLTLLYLKQDIIAKGHAVGGSIGEVHPEEFKIKESEFNQDVQILVNEAVTKIEGIIKDAELQLEQEMHQFANKDATLNYSRSLDLKLSTAACSPEAAANLQKNVSRQKSILEKLSFGSSKILEKSINPNSIGNGLKAVSGSQVHTAVKQVGGFFGKKFKPWEAVKITGKIGKAARFAGPALSVLSLGLDIWEKKKSEDLIKSVQKSKDMFFTEVSSFAEGLKREIERSVEEYFINSYDMRLSDLSLQKTELIDLNETNTRFSEAISKLDAEYVEFFEMVEAN